MRDYIPIIGKRLRAKRDAEERERIASNRDYFESAVFLRCYCEARMSLQRFETQAWVTQSKLSEGPLASLLKTYQWSVDDAKQRLDNWREVTRRIRAGEIQADQTHT